MKGNIVTKENRNKELVAYYKSTHSMRECAIKFFISLERVRQILTDNAPNLIRPRYDTRNHSSNLSSRER